MKKQSKPIFEHRISVELCRSKFSREAIKRTDKIFKTDKRVSKNYTGVAGRRLCFQFETIEEKEKFKTTILVLIKSLEDKRKL